MDLIRGQIPPSGLEMDNCELHHIDRELCSRPGGLRRFVEIAWHQVEPARRFQSNWHIDAICDHLEAVLNRDITRLIINIPPGAMKSLCCSVFWQAWAWSRDPSSKWITASFSDRIARRDGLRSRQLMETPWYQARWGNLWRPNRDKWSATTYENDRAGFRFATTVGGGVTGEHGDHQLVDDPIKPLAARQDKVDTLALQECVEWWDGTMSTRLVDPSKSTRTIVMQRLHQKDLTGHVLERGGYEHLMLPMRYEAKRKCVIEVTGFEDPREEEGELLWPERFPEEALKIRAKELTAIGVAGQEQQRPSPAAGNVVKKKWIQYWTELPEELIDWFISWDMTFKKTGSSWVVGQVWARHEANKYLIDQVRDRWSFTETKHEVIKMGIRYPKAAHLIEEAANGHAILSDLKGIVRRLIPVGVAGTSKFARLSAVTPDIEAGDVWFPPPNNHPWVEDMVERLIAFPNAANDEADTLSQALERYKTITRTFERFAIPETGLSDKPLFMV